VVPKACRQMREIFKGVHVPIVLCTALGGGAAAIQHTMLAGATDYLLKPCASWSLSHKLKGSSKCLRVKLAPWPGTLARMQLKPRGPQQSIPPQWIFFAGHHSAIQLCLPHSERALDGAYATANFNSVYQTSPSARHLDRHPLTYALLLPLLLLFGQTPSYVCAAAATAASFL
jgi:CheY-like chemotaxis protein